MVRTEGEEITTTSASSNTSGIIISIRISLWTRRLEYPRVRCRLARLRTPKASRTAISRGVEGKASTLAGHHSPIVMRPHLKIRESKLTLVLSVLRKTLSY